MSVLIINYEVRLSIGTDIGDLGWPPTT